MVLDVISELLDAPGKLGDSCCSITLDQMIRAAKPTFVPTASQLTPVSSIRVRQPTMTTNPEIRYICESGLQLLARKGNHSHNSFSFVGEAERSC